MLQREKCKENLSALLPMRGSTITIANGFSSNLLEKGLMGNDKHPPTFIKPSGGS